MFVCVGGGAFLHMHIQQLRTVVALENQTHTRVLTTPVKSRSMESDTFLASLGTCQAHGTNTYMSTLTQIHKTKIISKYS